MTERALMLVRAALRAMNWPDRERWRRLSPLLDELLELGAGERARRLAELRSSDAELADEVQALLGAATDAQAAGFLEADLTTAHGAMVPTLAGKRIGAYVLESPLGEGAMGVVWRARRADGRYVGAVAVKLLHLSQIGRAGALRIEREGAILARLAHPHIARLLDAGITDEGQPYLVLELVEGERIDHYCDFRKLTIEQRLALFDDVLAAVAHAHSHLVIHRDIKPNNILVAADGTVKLLDFGIAKLLLSPTTEAAITVEGQTALTPQYAAPEQVQGALVTTATDVYALGVLLYGLLVGRHPTAPDTASSAEVLRATLDAQPLRLTGALSERGGADAERIAQVAARRGTTPARLRRQLQGDLEHIVAQALRKEPAQRYQTVAALAEDLRRHRAHERVSAGPDSIADRCARFVRRNRGTAVAAALVVVAVMAGLGGTITQAQRAQRERDAALRDLGYAQSTAEFIGFLLQDGSNKPYTTAELLARAEPVLDQQSSNDPAQRAHLLLILAVLHGQVQNEEKAMELLLRAQASARDVADVSLRSEIACQLAFEYGITGAFEQSHSQFDQAIAQLRAEPQLDHALLAQCLQSRSEVVGLKGDGKAALVDAQAAFDTLQQANQPQRAQIVITRATLSGALSKVGRSAEAAAELRRAIAELDALGRGRTQQAMGLHSNLGSLLGRVGQPLAAVAMFQHALELAPGFGGVPPAVEGNYALNLIELGRPREAIALIEHATGEANAHGDRRTASILFAQGAQAWCLTGALQRCADLLARAQAELTALLPAGHSMWGRLEIAQAQLALARGDLAAAYGALKQAVTIFDAATDLNPSNGVRALTLLARTELQLGDVGAARSHAVRAVEQAQHALSGFDHSQWFGSALVARGLAERARHEFGAARDSWRAALVELKATVGDAAPAYAEVRQLLDALPAAQPTN
jgi:eukaryotic-like serine/threonine-protein kinase